VKISQSIFRIAAISLLTLGVSISAVEAAELPGDRPITFVVPFSAGGPTDKVARELALAMG
jgi:tripartite-type tricarboxylate transporter receptor subunit TctC